MTAELAMGNPEHLNGNRWGLMLAISIILHLSVFSAAIFLPGVLPSRDIDNVVYEVDLVEMPSSSAQAQATSASKTEETAAKVSATARRIDAQEEKKAPIEVEKIPVNKKNTAVKKEKTSPSKPLDTAISKLEKKVKSEDGNQLDKAISELKKKTKSEENHLNKAISQLQNKTGVTASKGGASGTGSIEGLPMSIYKGGVASQIKGNWKYPADMQNLKDLEATVLLKVKEDGTILESKFIKKSRDSIFDQSVSKAIEKSNPLPPFPEGRRISYDEIEITFNLKDLLDK